MGSAKTAGRRSYRLLEESIRSFAPMNADGSGGTRILTLWIGVRSMNIHVRDAEGDSQYMEMPSGSTAAMSATSLIDMEGMMEKSRFNDETLYQATMSMARELLNDGVIDEENYKKIRIHFLEKYQPIIGSLSLEMS